MKLTFRALQLALIASFISNLFPSHGYAEKRVTEPTYEVVLASEIKWEQLNPARGDKSPMAANLWGNRKKEGKTGFLVKFIDGFSSPPHIHNVSYRGVVIDGLIHNDDPEAKPLWMPPGSYWSQPAGEAHITSARGRRSMVYVEIDKGPYLVLPTEKSFDNGEKPFNQALSNIVWLDASNCSWIKQPIGVTPSNGAKVAFLWGKPQHNQLNGTLIKLPRGFVGDISVHGSKLRAVVISGQLNYQVANTADAKILEPGSYFSSTGEALHKVSCNSKEGCLIYIRTKGKFEVSSGKNRSLDEK